MYIMKYLASAGADSCSGAPGQWSLPQHPSFGTTRRWAGNRQLHWKYGATVDSGFCQLEMILQCKLYFVRCSNRAVTFSLYALKLITLDVV